jgi:hypothetical protein
MPKGGGGRIRQGRGYTHLGGHARLGGDMYARGEGAHAWRGRAHLRGGAHLIPKGHKSVPRGINEPLRDIYEPQGA